MAASPLPPQSLIWLGKFTWEQLWHIMMGKLAPRNRAGEYLRPASQFRDIVDPQTVRPGRYGLIVGMGCPWAHRTLIVRALKGLEAAIPLLTVTASPLEGGWVFANYRFKRLAEMYANAQVGYQGRSTVPVLWDTQTDKIINNESADIIVQLNSAWNQYATHPETDLYPLAHREAIDNWNEKIYGSVNNGVYRCGFAQTQAAYDEAMHELFSMLDEIDRVLANQHYLCGEALTLADVRLFTTLIRFDLVYYGLFKCNQQRIKDYPYLSTYVRDIYQLPGVAATCDLQAIKQDYYGNLFPLNPGGIIPTGPDMSYLSPQPAVPPPMPG